MEEGNRKVILEAQNISKHFGGLKAVDGVNLKLRAGEILAIIGPNGAGKTTTFNLISGVLPVTHGNILFNGQDITNKPSNERCQMGIGRTFQIMQPFEDMTVLENVTTGALFGGKKPTLKEAKTKAEAICERLGLLEYKDYEGAELPLAHRKRLEIARAYATDPEIFLFDEIMEGLNPVEANDMIALVKSLREEGKSVIMIDHIMFTVKELADWVFVMDYGKKLVEGVYADVVKSPAVIEAYLGKEED